jgi:hypothetical protein
MDMGVDEPGKYDVVPDILQPGAGRYVGSVRQDGGDPPAGDRDRRGACPLGGDDAR